MPPSIAELQFIVDENLSGVGRALAVLRPDLACVGLAPVDDLLPQGIGDTDWIPIVGARGWIMITDDKRLRTRPTESALAIEHELKVIHLYEAGHLTRWNQVVRLLSRWTSIQEHIAANADGPWWLSVRSDRIRRLQFQPGATERA